MSSDLFRNQADSNSPPTPLHWISPLKTIPEWLSGVYFQIGPSFFDINAKGETTSKQFAQSVVQMKIVHFKHWFDGLSHVHRFELKGGSKDVLWNHSIISRPYEKKISETATIDHTTFGPVVIENHEVSSTVIDAFKAQSIPNDNRYINQDEVYNNNLGIQTVKYNNKDHVIVTGYSSVVEEINPIDYTSSKIGNLIHSSFYPSSHYIYTPHKRYDPTTNELFSLVLEVGKVSSTFHILCTSFPVGTDPSRTKPRTLLYSSIPNVRVGYNHSFAITPHFIVIMNCPYHAGTIGSGLKLALNQGSIQKTMKFSDQLDENAICYVISRETGNLVKTFESAGFFYLNIINSFEKKIYQPKTDVEEEPRYNVFVDIVAYTNTSILNIFEIDQLRTPNQIDNTVNKKTWSNTIRRYCLPGISSSQVENNDSASVPYWEQVKEKVENPSWFVNSLVKPFVKLYYTASGNPENANANQSNNSSNDSIKLTPLGSSSKKTSASSVEVNPLNSKLNESDLDVRFEYPASFQHLCNTTIEFPCINNNYSYKDYRFVYGLFHPKKEKVFFTHLIKIDVQTMRVIKFDPTSITNNPYDYEGDVTITMSNEKVDIIPAGTPTFVPKPASAIVHTEDDDDGEIEDEGTVIAPFFDKLNKRSILIFVDAKTFMEIGRINLPNNEFMPFGSQGTFCTI